MPTAHLLSGLPCSGKSTFAKFLVEENGGVLFSLDYWLITLHGRYSLADVGNNEHVRRVIACRQIISDVACEFLRHGLDVVLDDGFFLSEHRMQQINAFKSVVAHSDAAHGVRVLTKMSMSRPMCCVLVLNAVITTCRSTISLYHLRHCNGSPNCMKNPRTMRERNSCM